MRTRCQGSLNCLEEVVARLTTALEPVVDTITSSVAAAAARVQEPQHPMLRFLARLVENAMASLAHI